MDLFIFSFLLTCKINLRLYMPFLWLLMGAKILEICEYSMEWKVLEFEVGICEHNTRGGSNMHFNHANPTKFSVSSLLWAFVSPLTLWAFASKVDLVLVISFTMVGTLNCSLLSTEELPKKRWEESIKYQVSYPHKIFHITIIPPRLRISAREVLSIYSRSRSKRF